VGFFTTTTRATCTFASDALIHVEAPRLARDDLAQRTSAPRRGGGAVICDARLAPALFLQSLSKGAPPSAGCNSYAGCNSNNDAFVTDTRLRAPPHRAGKIKGSEGSFRVAGTGCSGSAPERARSVPNDAAPLCRLRRSRRSSCAWCVTPCFPGWRRAPLGRRGGETCLGSCDVARLRRWPRCVSVNGRARCFCTSNAGCATRRVGFGAVLRAVRHSYDRGALCRGGERATLGARGRRAAHWRRVSGAEGVAFVAPCVGCAAARRCRGRVGTAGVVTRRDALVPAQA
jgi:hypothetical protein